MIGSLCKLTYSPTPGKPPKGFQLSTFEYANGKIVEGWVRMGLNMINREFRQHNRKPGPPRTQLKCCMDNGFHRHIGGLNANTNGEVSELKVDDVTVPFGKPTNVNTGHSTE